jgi:hypothetical protein
LDDSEGKPLYLQEKSATLCDDISLHCSLLAPWVRVVNNVGGTCHETKNDASPTARPQGVKGIIV